MSALAYHDYLKSPEWSQKRQEALHRSGGNSLDGPKCEACDTRAHSLDVHHLHYRNLGHEPLNDLVVLCRECHDHAHANHEYRTKIERIAEERDRHQRTIKALRIAATSDTFDKLMRGDPVPRFQCDQDWLERYGYR